MVEALKKDDLLATCCGKLQKNQQSYGNSAKPSQPLRLAKRSTGYERITKRTRNRIFLEEMHWGYHL